MRLIRLDQGPAVVLRIREPDGVVIAVCGRLADDELRSLASAVLSPAEYDELRSSLHLDRTARPGSGRNRDGIEIPPIFRN